MEGDQTGLADWSESGWLAGPRQATPPLNSPSPRLVFVLKTLYNADIKVLDFD